MFDGFAERVGLADGAVRSLVSLLAYVVTIIDVLEPPVVEALLADNCKILDELVSLRPRLADEQELVLELLASCRSALALPAFAPLVRQ